MNGFIKRIESLKAHLAPLESILWILKNGEKVPARGMNEPMNFITHGRYAGVMPTVTPTAWESPHMDEADPITRALMDSAVAAAQSMSEWGTEDPTQTLPERPVEEPPQEDMPAPELIPEPEQSTTAPNLPSKGSHCI